MTTREAIIKQLLEQDIFQKLISNAQHYQASAKAQLSAAKLQDPENSANIADHDRKLSEGHWSHKEYIDIFMGCIEFLITNSKNGNLSYQHIS